MREILFRGKRMDNGEWVESGSISRVSDDGVNWDYYLGAGAPAIYMLDEHKNMLEVITQAECVFYRVDPDSIGQYTGFCDTNGKKIFEGDILKGYEYPFCYNGDNGDEFNYFAEVIWFDNTPAFGIYTFKNPQSKVRGLSTGNTDFLEDFEPASWEVIGNIHDNPELLGEGK